MLIVVSASAENIHDVKKGDTLWDISSEYYGDSWQWPIIWKGNAQINNPDLIYPNEKLLIPGLPEGGEAIYMGGGLIKIEVPESFHTDRKQAIDADIAIESFDYERLNGFEVVLDIEPVIKIISTELQRDYVATNDEISIDGGINQGLEDGDTLVIYSKEKKLDNGQYVYACAGYAKVSKAGDDTSEAVIYKSFTSIGKGFYVVKSEEIKAEKPLGFVSAGVNDVSGKIIHNAEGHRFSAEGYYVIIDIGKESPIKPGDRFEIFSETNDNGLIKTDNVGTGQLVLISDHYSTMFIINSVMEIKKGDIVKLSKVSVF